MVIIKNISVFNIGKANEYLLMNLNNGLLDIIGDFELNVIQKWSKDKYIRAFSSSEKDLYRNLISRGYIMESHEEEQLKRNNIIEVLRDRYSKEKNNIDDVIIIFSYECNFKCPYCFEGENSFNSDNMTKNMIDSIYLNNRNIKSMMLYGGEPLLKKNKALINYTINKFSDVRYRIITNGYNIDYYIDILKKIRIDWIQITLDGKEETHNRFRILKNGEGTYRKIIENISILIQNKIPLKIRMNISEKNIFECLELKEELKEKYNEHKDLIAFELQPLYQITASKRIEIENIINNSKDFKDNVLGNHTRRIQSSIETKYPIKPIFNTCMAETKARIFDCNGNIYSCMLSVGNEVYSIGKYYPNETYKTKSLINRNINTIPKCKKCKFSIMCGGGCGYNSSLKQFEYIPNCFSFFSNLEMYVNKLGYKLLGEVIL